MTAFRELLRSTVHMYGKMRGGCGSRDGSSKQYGNTGTEWNKQIVLAKVYGARRL